MYCTIGKCLYPAEHGQELPTSDNYVKQAANNIIAYDGYILYSNYYQTESLYLLQNGIARLIPSSEWYCQGDPFFRVVLPG